MADMTEANEILKQLGGPGKLKAMIGAKDFMGSYRMLKFKWTAPSKNKANAVVIELLDDDTYRMEFFNTRDRFSVGGGLLGVIGRERLHANQLKRAFTSATGLDLSL